MTSGSLFVLLLVTCGWQVVLPERTCSAQWCYVSLQYPDHFAIYNDSLLVGLRNAIIHLTLDLNTIQTVPSIDAERNESCHLDARTKKADCQNYHRSIIFPRGDQVIVGDSMNVTVNKTFIACGTNYLNPSCQYRLLSDLSLVRKQVSIGFCPEQADIGTAFVEFNTTLWVGTVLARATDGTLIQSQQPFDGSVVHSTVLTGGYWLKASSFVDMYENGEYVYAFFREIALELNLNTVRSRVSRICKSDAGQRSLQTQTYQTYLKAGIRCVVQGIESDDERYRDIPFYYDNLYDTTLVKSGSYNQSANVRPMQVYGVFQNSGNGPIGSAVCVFTLGHMQHDVSGVFQREYLTRITSSNTWERASNENPFTCAEGRSVEEAETNMIMYNDVTQANSAYHPLYIKNGYKFLKIAVGQVLAFDGVLYELLFVAIEDTEGKLFIAKVSYVEQRDEQRTVEHAMLELDQSEYRVNHMEYHEQEDGQDLLYISTPNRLYSMDPFYCSMHSDCVSCVASMDPYCAYDTVHEACMGVNSANQNASLQNVSSGVADCPTVVPTSTHISISSSSSSITVIPTVTTDNVQATSGDDKGMWEWAAIGGGVGLCVGVVIGIFLMFAWQRRLGVLRYCSEDRTDSGDELNCKGAYGVDDGQKKNAYNIENGVLPSSESFANGRSESYRSSTKGKNNYESADKPPRYQSHFDQSKPSYNANCDQSKLGYNAKHDPSLSLHQRRTSQPVSMLKMHQSPERLRSTSVVAVTSEAVSNRDMARYGSNYSLDPDTSKPTLTPNNNVYFDSTRDSIDLDQHLYKSTDC